MPRSAFKEFSVVDPKTSRSYVVQIRDDAFNVPDCDGSLYEAIVKALGIARENGVMPIETYLDDARNLENIFLKKDGGKYVISFLDHKTSDRICIELPLSSGQKDVGFQRFG